jgi:hypothetical protein
VFWRAAGLDGQDLPGRAIADYLRRFLNRHRCSGDAGLSVMHPLETIGVAAVE